MSHEKATQVLSIVLTAITGGGGVISTMNTIEQTFRILLLIVSILSGCFLILVNWEKAASQIRQFIRRKPKG